MKIETGRLILISATEKHITAEIESTEKFGTLIEAEIPEGWPPGEYDLNAQEFFRKLVSESKPVSEGWYNWYALLKREKGEKPVVIGAGGYTGIPDHNGNVEIGYSIVSSFRRNGFATEFMRALVERAFSFEGVTRITAHTTPENIGSCRVLTKLGFIHSGPGPDFGTIRFILDRKV